MRSLEDLLFYLEDLKQLIDGHTSIFIRDDLIIKYSGPVHDIPEVLLSHDVTRCQYNFITDQLTIYIRA